MEVIKIKDGHEHRNDKTPLTQLFKDLEILVFTDAGVSDLIPENAGFAKERTRPRTDMGEVCDIPDRIVNELDTENTRHFIIPDHRIQLNLESSDVVPVVIVPLTAIFSVAPANGDVPLLTQRKPEIGTHLPGPDIAVRYRLHQLPRPEIVVKVDDHQLLWRIGLRLETFDGSFQMLRLVPCDANTGYQRLFNIVVLAHNGVQQDARSRTDAKKSGATVMIKFLFNKFTLTSNLRLLLYSTNSH